jgi:putative tryptophan/tyrosine transport system substrate-binding protein
MKRREFVMQLGGAFVAWPLAARAQQSTPLRRIGVFQSTVESDPEGQRQVKAFVEGLKQLGWIPGQNVQIEYRWGGADLQRIRTYAAEVVRLKPDVILASSSLVVMALQQKDNKIPIVFTQITDPVGSGFVASLARPGGNLTGFTPFEFSATAKWLEILKQIAPGVTRVAVLLNPDQPPNVGMLRALEPVSASLGMHLTAAGVHDAGEIERAISTFAQESKGGLIVLPNPIASRERELIVTLAARHRLPAVYAYRYFVTAGGLVSYGVDLAVQFRRAAGYVDRILRGTKPGDLPVEQPTKFDLLINLKTAKALGITIPQSLLVRADEVIQ